MLWKLFVGEPAAVESLGLWFFSFFMWRCERFICHLKLKVVIKRFLLVSWVIPQGICCLWNTRSYMGLLKASAKAKHLTGHLLCIILRRKMGILSCSKH